MIVPVTIGSQGQFLDEAAYLTAVTSSGMLAGLQVSVATILAESSYFVGDMVPVVVEAVGDYVSEMNRLIAGGTGLFLIVSTPDFRHDVANAWVATVKVQAIERPVVNRSRAGRYFTAQRACEVILATLKDRQPSEGWGVFRPRPISVVQSERDVSNFECSGITRTIVRAVSA